MILLDAVYINNGGGKILLDYLILKLIDNKVGAYLLLDHRTIESFNGFSNENINIEFIKPSLFTRHKFYKENNQQFSKILCFGNLPPIKKMEATTYTYLHQRLFLDQSFSENISCKDKIAFYLKSKILALIAKNTDYWIVQTKSMANLLEKSFKNVNPDHVLIHPFYPPLTNDCVVSRDPCHFVYVSSGADHKNHEVLLQGFCLFYDKFQKGELHLTIDSSFIHLQQKIKQLQLKGYPVINHIEPTRDIIANLFQKSKYCLYPSLSESLGLTIIEALENGCDIIGADLPYLYEVCRPSATFDPKSPESLFEILNSLSTNSLPSSKQMLHNNIEDLIKLLQ
ncbi:hypothetical protein AAU57_12540 [Nonlabens sp. YIK11]|uniref:glycosyltransferase n=1 Tax=Nonlabens sp. YIK11 TaxID=1453349 RepID=UPI0006DCFDCB|nr:glycosyltransferase [Nonlabens sp. YIK11]KQC34066.1 hypothetical protein AAU57_12540 [Nonlabens sp. YIK11]